MSTKRSVPFAIRSTVPTTLDVEGVDGRKYEIRLAIAVFDVTDNGIEDDPQRFNVRANVALDVKSAQ